MPNISVIGTGAVGRFLTLIFASHPENKVSIFDVMPTQVEDAMKFCRERLTEYENRGWLRGSGTAEEQMARIQAASSLEECLKEADYIQENLPEVLDMKKDIFKKFDQLAPKDCLRCSSSSCIPASHFTESLENRGRCMVAHPVNPPYFVPLVELVSAPWTEEDTVQKVKAILEKVGQSPIVLKKESMGFAVNRIQYAIINETWNLVQDGFLSPEDADKVMTHGLGPRYAFEGPLTVMQLNAHGIENYCSRYKAGMLKVSADLKGVPSFDGPTLKTIADSLNERIPVEEIPERLLQRSEMLAELCVLKKKSSQ